MSKSEWILLKVEGESHILTDSNDRAIRAILLERFQPYTIVECVDYSTGELLDKLRLDELYSK